LALLVSEVVTIYFGGVATDVSSYVYSIQSRRGRSRELDTFTAGGCTIVLDNYDRRFDPTNTAGPYRNQLIPRVRVNVSSDSISLFDGFVEDWSYSYDIEGRAQAVVRCVDALAILSQTVLDEFTNTQDTPAERITSILSRPSVGFTGKTNLDAGFNPMQADTVAAGTNTLQYLQQVAATDYGRLFVDGAGVLRYRSRTSGVKSDPLVAFGFEDDPLVIQLDTLSGATLWLDAAAPRPLRIDAAAQGQVVLQDATLWFDASDPSYIAPVIEFGAVEVGYGSEFLFNRIVIARAGGASMTASDSSSVASYGIRAYSSSAMLFISDAAAQSFADYLLTEYAQPVVRVASHEIPMAGLSEVHARYVKRLEIGDLVRTVWTPLGAGVGFDIVSFVEGVEHQIVTGVHVITLQLTPLIDTGGFILDDLNDGLLDSSELTY
jgi:hypothetical protein